MKPKTSTPHKTSHVDIETEYGTLTASIVGVSHILVEMVGQRGSWSRLLEWSDGEVIGWCAEISEDDQRTLTTALLDAGLVS